MLNLRKYILSIVLIVCISATVYSQNQALTLDMCRDMAVENNMKMKSANAAVQQAKDTKKGAFTNFFPNVSAVGIAMDMNKPLIEMDMGPLGSMSMLKDGILGALTLTQPVFVGGQIINGNKLASIGITVSELQLAQSRNEVLLTTEQYYWQIISLKEKEHTLLTVKNLLDTLNHDVEVALKAGVAYNNDKLQVQLRKNEVESSLSNVRSGIDVCRMVLAQYIGLSDNDWDLTGLTEGYILPDPPQSYYQDPESSLGLTPEYNLLTTNVKAQNLQYKLEVGKNLPTVAVGAGYVYDNLMDKSHNFLAGFVNVSIPITGWWGGSYSMKKQKTAVNIAEMDFRDKSELLIVRMHSAWSEFNNSYNQISVAIESIEQSRENLRLAQQRYIAGTISMTDLLEAQALYQQSCDKYADSYADYCVKRVIYLQSTGR
ncbi:MAG: TolC family protein [Bacteroides sp.]|nr:TolC family protein [Bacteroides sp.]